MHDGQGDELAKAAVASREGVHAHALIIMLQVQFRIQVAHQVARPFPKLLQAFPSGPLVIQLVISPILPSPPILDPM